MAGDSNFANVKLLIPCDGYDGSTTFWEANGRTVTPAGNAQIKTAQSKFYGSSAYFDGTGDYLSTSLASAVGTGSMTIELWVRAESTGDSWAGLVALSAQASSPTGPIITLNGTAAPYKISMSETWAANTTTSSATCVSADTWHHIAWVRNGSAVNLYVDGVSRVSATWSTNYTSTTVAIGSRYHTSPLSYFKGYIQSPRITYSAVYTADFTPPTTPFAPYLYGVAGSVTESLAIEDWVVSSHRADTAALLQQATVYQDKTYAVSSAGVLVPVYVACRPRITGKWVANTAYAARAIIAPTDPVTTPYIFKCTTAGTSHGTTEPIWDTTAGNITSDGSAVWTSLGRLPQAILHGPLIPS